MPRVQKGARVGAVLCADEKVVSLLGYGVYEGEVVPELSELGIQGTFLGMLGEKQIPNPKIRLDNGAVVWGCQCWWGSEEQVKAMIGSREVMLVDLEGKRIEEEIRIEVEEKKEG